MDTIKLMTERLRGRLDAAAHAGSWIDLQSMLMRYTVDVTASLAFGIDVNTIQQTHSTFQQNLDKLLPVLMRRTAILSGPPARVSLGDLGCDVGRWF